MRSGLSAPVKWKRVIHPRQIAQRCHLPEGWRGIVDIVERAGARRDDPIAPVSRQDAGGVVEERIEHLVDRGG